MYFERLAGLLKKPRIYTITGTAFWEDPYISKHALEAHLDEDNDDASRQGKFLQKSLPFIIHQGKGKGTKILDLGCGPGLYTTPLAEEGWEVTGIDYSPSSIEYAQKESRERGLEINYKQADIRSLEFPPASFDIITIIYGSFCTLIPKERDLLLSQIFRWLKPQGKLIFDVFTPSYLEITNQKDWYYRYRDGFWRKGEHITLEDKVFYNEGTIRLDRYIVLESRDIKAYHIWHTAYQQFEIDAVLEKAGFKENEYFGDLRGTPYDKIGKWIGIVCHKEEII